MTRVLVMLSAALALAACTGSAPSPTGIPDPGILRRAPAAPTAGSGASFVRVADSVTVR